MKPHNCPRKWQLEAVRDGRLTGKDRDSAVRHQASCTECAEEERRLAALGEQVARLPELPRDPMSARRARQRLIAALNELVIEPRARRLGPRAALGLGFAAAAIAVALVWLTLRRPPASPSSPADSTSVIEVHATPGARWSEHVDRTLDRIDLVDGTASFKVRPHAGRHVVIGLPDGELEDLGTVFEILVAEQHTRRISVSQGRVSVRLLGQPNFSLSAGETWGSEAAAASASAAQEAAGASALLANQYAARGSDATPNGAASSKSEATLTRPRAASSGEARATSASARASAEQQAAPDAQAAKAEDDAYLQIVDLLKQAKYARARSEAKQYLLRFPNGFRRIEVLNIATHALDDESADAGH